MVEVEAVLGIHNYKHRCHSKILWKNHWSQSQALKLTLASSMNF